MTYLQGIFVAVGISPPHALQHSVFGTLLCYLLLQHSMYISTLLYICWCQEKYMMDRTYKIWGRHTQIHSICKKRIPIDSRHKTSPPHGTKPASYR